MLSGIYQVHKKIYCKFHLHKVQKRKNNLGCSSSGQGDLGKVLAVMRKEQE